MTLSQHLEINKNKSKYKEAWSLKTWWYRDAYHGSVIQFFKSLNYYTPFHINMGIIQKHVKALWYHATTRVFFTHIHITHTQSNLRRLRKDAAEAHDIIKLLI